MDGLKIGGIFYGADIQKAMEASRITIMDAAKKVYKEDYDHINTIKTAIKCYEDVLLEMLKNDKRS